MGKTNQFHEPGHYVLLPSMPSIHVEHEEIGDRDSGGNRLSEMGICQLKRAYWDVANKGVVCLSS